MSKATAVLFGIEDEFDVVGVNRLVPDQVKILIELQGRGGEKWPSTTASRPSARVPIPQAQWPGGHTASQ